jgi:cobalt-zinc-cadmium efflux system membrane fusion protein
MKSIGRVIAWLAVIGALGAGMVWADRLGERRDSGYEPAADAATVSSSTTRLIELNGTSQRLVGLETAKAEARHAQRAIRASCQVQLDANRQVLVKTLVSGFIEKRLIDQGQHVRAGDPLFVMRSNDLALAKGGYLQAKSQLELAKAVLSRDDALIKDKIVSQTQYDSDRAAWLTARGAYVNAREQLLIDGLAESEIEGLTYETQASWLTTIVKSPIEGEVIQLTNAHTRGDLISAGTDLCQVADLTQVWVIGNAYEKDIAHLHTGSLAKIEFVSYPGHVWHGGITAIADVVNSATRTVDVRVALENKPSGDPGHAVPERFPLKPGLFGTMEAFCDEYPEDWIWLPASALLPYFLKDGCKAVYVAVDGEHFGERHVRVVSQEGNDVAVTGELKPGERVVTDGNIFLRREGE